jgi:peptide/nickel transport system permease protein
MSSSGLPALRRPGPVARLWGRVRLLRESPIGMVGAGLVLFWVAVAVLAPWIAPHDPNESNMDALDDFTPSAINWLGTDSQGRDILSRIIWGSRTVLGIGPLAVLIAYAIGCMAGLLAGYYRGWVDQVVSRIADIVLSFPAIVLYIIVIMRLGPSGLNIIMAVIFIASPQIARIVRGMTLELREQDYVAAAKMRGESGLYIMLAEILPNARGPLIVDACLRMGYTTITIGVLGFLGLGLPPPDPDWGGMVKDSYAEMSDYPHMSLFPALAITSLVVGFSLLADGIREISLKD